MEATATVLSNLYLLTHFEPSVIEDVTIVMGAPSHPNLRLWNPWPAILAPLRIGNRPIGMIYCDGRPLPSRSNRRSTRPSSCSIKSNHAEHESVGGSPVTNRQSLALTSRSGFHGFQARILPVSSFSELSPR